MNGIALHEPFRRPISGAIGDRLFKGFCFMGNEVWRDIEGWPYEVSSLGNVRHRETKKIRKIVPSHTGYAYIGLYKDGKNKNFFVHRLVAAAFLGEIYDQVDHVDGNRMNARLDNLRLCTRRENQIFYTKNTLPGTFLNRLGTWTACLSFKHQNKFLGNFATQEEAHARYLEAVKEADEAEKYPAPPYEIWVWETSEGRSWSKVGEGGKLGSIKYRIVEEKTK